MANENQNLMLAGLFDMLAALIPFFRRAGAPDVADELATITGRADARYHNVVTKADDRLGNG